MKAVFVLAFILFGAAIASQIKIDQGGVRNKFSPRRNNIPKKFDYIVLGGGIAGSVVASRLSENGEYDVLLLDQGTDNLDEELVNIPRQWDRTPSSHLDDTHFLSQFDENVYYDTDDRRLSLGRSLGGGSVVNAEMWVRGNAYDYDNWAALGNPGWSYTDVEPFFKKIETDRTFPNSPHHGHSGYMNVGQCESDNPSIDQAWVDAAQNGLGLPFNEDHNTGTQISSSAGSVSWHEVSVHNGTRLTAYGAYIKPFLFSRKNLWVVDSAWVTKINFNKKKEAISVDWYDNLEQEVVTSKAKKEIIISLGAIHSAHILQLSGVGDATALNNLDIDVVHDNPNVGKNLQDHLITTMGAYTSELVDNPYPAAPYPYQEQYFQQWRADRTGPLSCIGGRTVMFLRTKYQPATDPRPDIQYIMTPPGYSAFGVMYLLRPRSRGEVKIISRNPTDRPQPFLGAFSEEIDAEVMAEGLRLLHNLLTAAPLNCAPGAYPQGGFFQAPENVSDYQSVKGYLVGNAEYQTAAKSNTGNHLVGTCKMGPASDSTAVVDSRLRVKGVSNLRVVDASIMPVITSGNTQAPTYMIGERGASFILQDA